MTSAFLGCLYKFGVAYLCVNDEATPSEIIDAMIELRPEQVKGQTVHALRSKLTRAVTNELNYYGEDADIQRTGRKTMRLREGFEWPKD